MRTYVPVESKGTCGPPVEETQLAWIGVLADPARHVDRAIEAFSAYPPQSLVEIGPYASVNAARLAGQYTQVIAIGGTDDPANSGANGPSFLRAIGGALPLPSQSVNRAVARASLVGRWGIEVPELLSELERVVRREGLAVGVHCSFDDSDLGILASEAVGLSQAREREQSWAEAFGRHEFVGSSIPSFWRAPGRSILRRVLESELGGGRVPISESVVAAELSCTYRLYVKRIGG